jgi:hypothetical protein
VGDKVGEMGGEEHDKEKHDNYDDMMTMMMLPNDLKKIAINSIGRTWSAMEGYAREEGGERGGSWGGNAWQNPMMSIMMATITSEEPIWDLDKIKIYRHDG